MAATKTPRRVDRDRRQRIIRGAEQVIVEHGVEGLTHRLIADAANVPLAATTYYFDSLEDLLAAAMTDAISRENEALRDSFKDLPPDADLAEVIAGLIFRQMTTDRRNAVLVAELYTAAARRDELRQVAISWEAAWNELLSAYVSPFAAQTIGSVTSGLVQSALLRDETPKLEDVTAVVRLILAGDR